MRIHIFGFSLVVFVTELLLCGCQSVYQTRKAYLGPDLPQSQIALIEAEMNANGRRPGVGFGDILISGVDGKSYSRLCSAVTLLPGAHTISLTYRELQATFPYQRSYFSEAPTRYSDVSYYSEAPLAVSVDAAAGHTYSVCPIFHTNVSSSSGYTWSVKVVDKTSGTK